MELLFYCLKRRIKQHTYQYSKLSNICMIQTMIYLYGWMQQYLFIYCILYCVFYSSITILFSF